jgi:UDP-N-acetylmuramyl pentapeptide phosphotransferase/UDP-N-acetylglucosamine-1-phosphate transferase
MIKLVWAFLVASGLSWLLCFAAGRLLWRANLLDLPNQRSSHSRPTVRGGGIGILAGIVCVSAYFRMELGGEIFYALIVSSVCLGAVSFVDDLMGLSAGVRFCFHAVVAFTAVWVIDIPFTGSVWHWPFGVLLFLWVAGYVNAFNFMDGINGIAAGQAVMTAFAMAVLVLADARASTPVIGFSLVIATGAAGFLPHNFPRARMFMGDVGSAPLGFLLSATAIWVAQEVGWHLFPALVLIHANFVLDAGITLVRRICKGDRWYAPHREHFYQRFVRAGRSHQFVTAWEMGLQCLCLLLLVIHVQWIGYTGKLLSAMAVVTVWLIFFGIAEFEFRRYELRGRLG